MEFSKKLAIGILGFIALIIFSTFLVYLYKGQDVKVIMDFLSTPLMTIILSYFGKSAIENYTKINKNSNSSSENINEKL